LDLKKQAGRHYRHPQCAHIYVEFGNPPVAIGEDYKVKPREVKIEQTTIKILSPTDCIKDRLASYIHFKSRDSFEQAVLVARRQPFDLKKVREWCRKENSLDAFEEFRSALKGTEKK
jgi:hypothetical protein